MFTKGIVKVAVTMGWITKKTLSAGAQRSAAAAMKGHPTDLQKLQKSIESRVEKVKKLPYKEQALLADPKATTRQLHPDTRKLIRDGLREDRKNLPHKASHLNDIQANIAKQHGKAVSTLTRKYMKDSVKKVPSGNA